VVATIFVFNEFSIDRVIYGFLDPRIKYSQKEV
jgi:ABC-type dipeptide/oligopeptide/nickel transport system permease component